MHWDDGDQYFRSPMISSHSHARSCWDMNDLLYGVGSDAHAWSHDGYDFGGLELALGCLPVFHDKRRERKQTMSKDS